MKKKKNIFKIPEEQLFLPFEGETLPPVPPSTWYHVFKRVSQPKQITQVLTHYLAKEYFQTQQLPDFTNDFTMVEADKYVHILNKPENLLIKEAKSPNEFMNKVKEGSLEAFKPLYKGLISVALIQGLVSQEEGSEAVCVLSMGIVCKDGYYETQIVLNRG